MTKGLTVFAFTFIVLMNIIGTHLAAASARDGLPQPRNYFSFETV